MRSRLYFVLSVPLFAVLYAFTAVVVFILLIFALLKMKKAIKAVSQFWAQSVFILLGKKFEVVGKEKIKKDARYILVANHASLFDIVAIVSFFPGISWFGHERLLRIPLFGNILRMLDYVPFKEPNYRNTRKMIDELLEISQSNTVAMFPEGTRTLNGKINTFYRGFIYLCRTRDLEILPVTLNGFYDLKPKNRNYINFESRLSVVIHEPINKEALADKNDNEIVATVKEIIESAYNKSQFSKNDR